MRYYEFSAKPTKPLSPAQSLINPSKQQKERATKNISELLFNTTKNARVLPDVVKQNARVTSVVSDIAASDAQQAPTEFDKVLAMQRYSKLKKQTNKNYAQRLRQQLANAEANVK